MDELKLLSPGSFSAPPTVGTPSGEPGAPVLPLIGYLSGAFFFLFFSFRRSALSFLFLFFPLPVLLHARRLQPRCSPARPPWVRDLLPGSLSRLCIHCAAQR